MEQRGDEFRVRYADCDCVSDEWVEEEDIDAPELMQMVKDTLCVVCQSVGSEHPCVVNEVALVVWESGL
jgi:hypothetical protein